MVETSGDPQAEVVSRRRVFLTVIGGAILLLCGMLYVRSVSHQISSRLSSAESDRGDVDHDIEFALQGLKQVERLEWLLIGGLLLLVAYSTRTAWRYTLCHRQAEEAVRVSEAKYRGLYESSTDAVMLLDETQFFECNAAALRIFGLDDRDDLCSKHPAELSPPVQPNGINSVELANERIAHAFLEGSYRFEWVHRRKDGTDFPCEVLLCSLMIEGRQVLQTVVRDVTERKEAERQLKANEAKLRTIADSALDAVIMMDSAGRAVHWNPAAERIFGYTSDEMLGREIHPILAPLRQQNEAAQGLPPFFQSGAGRLVGQVIELQAVRKGGIEFPIEISISPIQTDDAWWAVAVARDITDRRKAEASLRQSHEELQAIYDGMADGLLIADIATRRFERANRAICTMLGYSPAEMRQLSIDDIHPNDAMPEVIKAFQDMVQQSLGGVVSLPVLRKDGSVFYADVTNTNILYHNRPCMIGFFRDISERKNAAEALKNEQQSLRRLLKAHDQERQLIAYEIHDGLAQQLVAAIMQCQAIEDLQSDLPGEVSETFGEVLRMLRQALNETRRLISGVRPPILDELGVVSAIRGLIHEMSTADGPEIELRAEADFDRIDPVIENSVYRIVQESLTNACRHSNSLNVRIELSQYNDLVRIEIRDWGVGYDPSEVDEKRYGLAGIRERVRLLGGRVRIDSKHGEGTRILVQLPLEVDESLDIE